MVRQSESDRYLDWRRDQIDAVRAEMSGDELAELEAAVRTDLLEERGGHADMGTDLLVRAGVDALLATKLDISRDAFRRCCAAGRVSGERTRKAS